MIVDVTNDLFHHVAVRGINLRPGAYDFSGKVEIEPPVLLTEECIFRHDATVGAFTYSWSRLRNIRTVGRYCSIARNVTLGEAEHPMTRVSTSSFTYDAAFIWAGFTAGNESGFVPTPVPTQDKPLLIEIGNDVWIGIGAYIRAGVKIGHGAVIGAHAVVVKDVPPYAVVVGNPGKIVKYRFARDVIERLLASEWWQYTYTDFAGMTLTDPEIFLDELEHKVKAGSIRPYAPEAVNPAVVLAKGMMQAAE
ncbi:CatB-related O-acetyltransferase [Rhizobium metallidurans]|uniref:Acetyltransferase-like isoleucine patch superfamily enzyme n=1 Tax=Rhizobium metallidurans TaxID=1265931 RepID=A0A7W6D084_9HYPH|nr:CatB-related O-acetyltransferase [Rhizobium metallidurans]MBB3966860.1 acetyltransferase-like isoleucine patch superfamily enzyme [Rhizobium metallidurans]